MEIAHFEIPFHSRSQTFNIYSFGDVHWGSANCDEEAADRDIDVIDKDPTARVFLMGDLCEYITRHDWRFDHRGIAAWVDEDDIGTSQMQYAVRKLKRIKRKILGALMGNHELALQQAYEQAVHKRLCEELGVRDLGYMALVRLEFSWKRGKPNKSGDYYTIDAILHHGWGGGRTDGADMNRLDDLLRDYNVDWAIAGHTHRVWASKSVQYRMNKHNQFDARIRLKARSGTYLLTTKPKTRSYAELQAMRPLLTGCLRVVVHPIKKEFVANV